MDVQRTQNWRKSKDRAKERCFSVEQACYWIADELILSESIILYVNRSDPWVGTDLTARLPFPGIGVGPTLTEHATLYPGHILGGLKERDFFYTSLFGDHSDIRYP